MSEFWLIFNDSHRMGAVTTLWFAIIYCRQKFGSSYTIYHPLGRGIAFVGVRNEAVSDIINISETAHAFYSF